MAALKYKEEHNKVGYLLKPTESDDYHQIIDILSESHIRYALTTNPIIFDSLVKQFWSTDILRAPELGPPAILATIDKTPYTITEALVRSHLQLADDGGVADLPIPNIYSGMDNLGYMTEGKLTFFKNKFSPHNIENAKKFLMFLSFLQTILGIETRVTRQYKVLAFSSKLFANMRLNFMRHPMPLLPAMLLQAQAGGGAEHDHCSNQREPTTGSFPSRDDAPLGSDFHPSPLRSSHAPPASQPSGDLDALRALANDAVDADSDIPSGHTSYVPAASPCAPPAGPTSTSEVPSAPSTIPPSASNAPTGALNVSTAASAIPADSLKVPVAVPADSPYVLAGVSNKGKSLMVEEDISVKARTFRQMEDDRLGEEATKHLHEEEMAKMERERAEA
uniref:Ribonuclease H-like domain-containing protein n=1 Tax=Tanacetum cinerariifolium TaxID=118510 RepID=A0A6L2L5B1_TANCI|nr:ribonuclease H-like domain-containing protein [Tanacetum cinerariifolium]